jgi:hypothetical protein
MRLLTFQVGMWDRPRYLRDMAHGAVAVWYSWLLLTIMVARFVLPVLVLALCIVSASPATDLMLVALAFVLATVAGAVAGLVLGASAPRHGFSTPFMYLSLLSVLPYLTLVGLIARAEHGVFVALAVVAGLAARPYVWRVFRRAWVMSGKRLSTRAISAAGIILIATA